MPGNCRGCGLPCCGLRLRAAAGSAEAVASRGGAAAAGSGMMMLTDGIEEAEGKNRLPAGLLGAEVALGGGTGAGLLPVGRGPAADCHSAVCACT